MQIARASPRRVSSEGRRLRRRAWLTAALALLLCGAIRESHAAADCSITAVSLNFGAYDPSATSPDDSAGTVTVTCRIITKAAAAGELHGDDLERHERHQCGHCAQMGAGAGRLGYNVFTDPARTQVWGNGNGRHGDRVGRDDRRPGRRQRQARRPSRTRVYGRIPQLQDAVPGTYSDTLLVTLTF